MAFPPEINWNPEPFWHEVFANRKREYLFFIGSTCLSLIFVTEKRWAWAVAALVTGIVWISFHPSLSYYLGSIGVDSLSEVEHLNLTEALFWLQTMKQVLRSQLNFHHLFVYSLMGSSVFMGGWLVSNSQWVSGSKGGGKLFQKRSMKLLSFLTITGALSLTVSQGIKFYLENSQSYLAVKRNFDNPVPELTSVVSTASLMVYIGESTTTMNMSLYGYQRITTPLLDQIAQSDKNLIRFENVFLTHTHTSPSLLEALSFGINPDELFLPIEKRQRILLTDVLKKADIEPILFSNQGRVGTWNQAGSVIFQNARPTFSTQSHRFGNADGESEKPWDNEFFDAHLKSIGQQTQPVRQAIFLHSYSGHGDYRKNIPPSFRGSVDDLIINSRPADIASSAAASMEMIDSYDSAIRYIDSSVAESITHAKAMTRPFVFVYFSDHGESVFTRRGHDSTRFNHEMLRVPLLIYFNEAAKSADPVLFEKYRALALTQETATLAQLPSTLLDLLGLSFKPETGYISIATPLIGEKTNHPPVVVRKTSSGTTFVNFNPVPIYSQAAEALQLIDVTDEVTKSYVRNRQDLQSKARLCHSRHTGQISLESKRRQELVGACQ